MFKVGDTVQTTATAAGFFKPFDVVITRDYGNGQYWVVRPEYRQFASRFGFLRAENELADELPVV